jgi:hypothetical protein
MEALKKNFSKIGKELKTMSETKKVSPKIGKLILNVFVLLWGMFKVFIAALYSYIFDKLNQVLPIPSIPGKTLEVSGKS